MYGWRLLERSEKTSARGYRQESLMDKGPKLDIKKYADRMMLVLVRIYTLHLQVWRKLLIECLGMLYGEIWGN